MDLIKPQTIFLVGGNKPTIHKARIKKKCLMCRKAIKKNDTYYVLKLSFTPYSVKEPLIPYRCPFCSKECVKRFLGSYYNVEELKIILRDKKIQAFLKLLPELQKAIVRRKQLKKLLVEEVKFSGRDETLKKLTRWIDKSIAEAL